MNISAVIITKNEENLIADAIDSVSFCNEVIVVDNNSSDRTAEIAKKCGAKVFNEETKDFSKLRNLGKEKTNSEWIFYLDADERVSDDLRLEILKKINSDNKYVAYRVLRKNFYLGNNEWPLVEKMERLFKRNHLSNWFGELHESPKVEGEVGEINSFLFHYTHRDITSMLNKTNVWSDVEAKNRYLSHHPKMSWWRFPRVMITTFINYYFRQKGYKLGTAGLVESIYQSYSIFITYAKLWELQNKKN